MNTKIIISIIFLGIGYFLGLKVHEKKRVNMINKYTTEQFNFITDLYKHIGDENSLDSVIKNRFYKYEEEFKSLH